MTPLDSPGSTAVASTRTPAGRGLKIALTLLTLAVGAALALRGREFYALDVAARVDHPDFRVLSPGEVVGHGYGVVGTLLMLTNLTYLLRRRFARLPLGSMRAWLDMHVFTGLLGSTLVVFHSAFQLRTPIAMITSLSLAAVVLSGVVGRFLYALTPQVDAARFARDLAALDAVVSGLSAYLRRELAALPAPTPAAGGLLSAIASVPAWRRELRQRRTVVRASVELAGAELAPPLRRALRTRGRAVERHARQVVNASLADGVLRSWRGLHRFMAILLVLSVSLHIAVAWFFGFRWIFGA